MRRSVVAGIAVSLVLALMPSGAAPRAARDAEVALDRLPASMTADADVRQLRLLGPSRSALDAALALRRRVPDLFVKWNARMGTAKLVFSDTGFLTASAGRAVGDAGAERIARAWIAAQRRLFGLSADAVRSLRITRNAAMPDGGPHALVFRQHYGAIPTFAGGTIGVNLSRDGRIGSVWADTGPTGTLRSEPGISAADALRAVAAREGMSSLRVVSLGQRATGDRLAIFAASGGYAPHNARLVAFPTAYGPRLAWRVFFAKGPQELLSTAVDAFSGQLLFRNNQVDHAEGDTGRVFRNHPGAPKGGRHEIVSFEGDPAASPEGWVAGAAGAPATTAGNNVVAFTDWGWPKLAAGGFAPVLALSQFNPVPDTMPVSPDRKFDFGFANAWNQDCEPVGETELGPIENPSYATDREASVTNVFYFGNKIHDFAYKYGFTEAMGNMQLDNFGKGGAALDPIRFMAQAGVLGGNLNNAFMFTPADGGEPTQFVDPENPAKVLGYIPPFSGMFLWRPIPSFQAPCVDGDHDASTAYHEYTHGISNRMTGGPDDADALNAHQSGSMGEAWSDWVAHILLDSENIEDRTADGIYITGNDDTGIRHFALDKNPLTYGDLGFGRFGPEVHDDGEIWSGALWDLRTALIRKHGKKKGLDRVTRLVFDGMATQPRLPDFLDARDAIIRAALMRYRSDVPLIWQVFARRGMGRSARSVDASDVNPQPGFDAPTGNGTFAGLIDDVAGNPLPSAKILIGLGEGKPTAVVKTSRSGSFRVVMAPGRYPVSVAAAGYGIQRLGSITVAAGRTTTLRRSPDGTPVPVAINRNLASVGWGAAVTGGLAAGDPGVALIDDHEFTGQTITVNRPVTIRLAGAAPATVRAVSVSQKPSSGGTVTNATDYILELSVDGRKWKKVYDGGVRRYRPRPGALQWLRPTKTVPGIKARYARLTVSETFGRGTEAIIANVQVYGIAPGMKVAPIGGEAPFIDPEGAIALANAGGPDASVTFREFALACDVPQAQGVDAYIAALPSNAGDGVHNFETKGGSELGRDLDVYFYDANCEPTGDIASGSADEAGPIPPGTKWAVVVLFAGTTDGFDIKVTTTLERVVPPAGVPTARPGRPGGGGRMPRTVERQYIAAGGDFADINCANAAGAPSIGAVCFEVRGGETINLTIADDVSDNVYGVYAFRTDPNDVIDDQVIEFCGRFATEIPGDVVLVVVYIGQVNAVLADCGPGTTGVATARIR